MFAGYLVLFAWLVTKVKFFTESGLTPAQLIIFFLLKVMAGIFYGWIGVYYGELAKMVDTWAYHYESLKEYQLLLQQPSEFFGGLFSTNHESGYSGFLSTKNSWWNDLKSTSFLKILAFFNVLSFGNYYVNVIFYSFISLFGPVAIYRIMKEVFPSKKMTVLLSTFLIPSFLYWTSGIHKDGIIFLGFALVVYHIYFGLKENKFRWQRLLLISLGLILVLALRNFLILIFMPALIAWILSNKLRYKSILVFSSVYLFFIVLFFTSRYIHPAFDFPLAVTERQQAFIRLSGNSAVEVNLLEPTFKGFVINAPQALSLSALRPYPGDVRHLLSMAAALEIGLLLLSFVVFLVCRKNGKSLNPFLLFCIFFSFSILIMIGYMVNFLGAIVRYRSIVLPFLIIPMMATIDWDKIKSLISKYIVKKNNI